MGSLQSSPELAGKWLPRLFSGSYDGELTAGKPGALFGMAMTEKQGGSDVRANSTRAVPQGDHFRLTGHKWFCSAPMSDAFLVLAQDEAGLGCFLVPRVLPDDSRNTFLIQRLKHKLGNRSNASAELEFANTAGWASGAMTNVLADLALESEAATTVSMRLSRAFDDDAGDSERAFRLLGTALTKYWVYKRGPNHAYEAMECLGGNGYSEDFPLAMRYREQPVMAIWEGTGNVIAMDVLRAMATEPEPVDAFFEKLRLAYGTHPIFDDFTARLKEEVAPMRSAPQDFAGQARNVVEKLTLALQASLLRFVPAAVSETFVSLPAGTGPLVQRRQPLAVVRFSGDTYASLNRGRYPARILLSDSAQQSPHQQSDGEHRQNRLHGLKELHRACRTQRQQHNFVADRAAHGKEGQE